MAFDFPSNPVSGEIWTDVATGATYMWSGFAWKRGYSEPPAGIQHPPAETIPVDPPIDGETSVDAVLRSFNAEIDQLATDSGQKVAKAGNTEGIMTGILTLSEHPGPTSGEFQAATKGFVTAVSLPTGGVEGQALTINAAGIPVWGAPIFGANF
jgi:hypothetical protein